LPITTSVPILRRAGVSIEAPHRFGNDELSRQIAWRRALVTALGGIGQAPDAAARVAPLVRRNPRQVAQRPAGEWRLAA